MPYQFSFLIPTRNNLPGLAKLFQSIVETTADLAALEIVLVVDKDDQQSQAVTHDRIRLRKVIVPKGHTMGELNNACFKNSSGRYIMLMNDDVILRTKNWDRTCAEVFAGFKDDIALIHVNDLLFRERLCTFPMLSRKACLAIGVCPKAYRRYRIDDHIYDTYNLLAHLGQKRIVYLPEVIFEHENHVSDGAPTEGHVFASADHKVYVPKAGIIEVDAKYCDEHFDDRKRDALKLAEIIETEKHARTLEQLRSDGAARLAGVADSHSYRRPEYLRTQPTGVMRDTINARTTVAVVTADLRGEVPQRCLAAIKKHTANYDLVILDNNRGPNFSHTREMNKVLAMAQTDFLVLMDDDVIVEAGWLDGMLRCMDAGTGVVVPMHKDAEGKISFTGVYLSGDGRGTHEHTFDKPDAPRPVQCYCSAAMLIDLRKCGHLLMDQAYSKYFFDLVHSFEVWEAGWKTVCCPDVIVTHIGGATMKAGSVEANALHEKDRATFIRAWVESGRLARLQSGIWRKHPYLVFLTELPKRIVEFLASSHTLQTREFTAQLASLVADCTPFNLLMHELRIGLFERLTAFQKNGEITKFKACIEADASLPDLRLERGYVISVANKLFETKQYDLAEVLLSRALQRQPDEIAFWRPLGYVRLQAHDFTGAGVAFEQALNHSPEDIESRGSLGGVLFLLKRPAEAIEQYETALTLCRRQTTAHWRIAELTENLAIARRALAEAGTLRTDPTPDLHAPLGCAKALQSEQVISTSSQPSCNSTVAQKILPVPLEFSEWQHNEPLSQAAKNNGKVPSVANLGSLVQLRLFLKQGDLVAAWQAGVEAIRLRPFHPECFLALAEIAQTAGDVTKARHCAEQARQLATKWKPACKFLKSLAPNEVSQRTELLLLPSDQTTTAPRLTVCLIVRNEEQFIGPCLESVRRIAGQIIVVDTGSTDRTKEIAASFGAEIYSFEWIDDFSAARNAALEHATGDWVVMLDADEELPPPSRELLQKEMLATQVMAYRLPIVDAGRSENGCNYVPRLFRNAPGIYYSGRIHEHAFSSVESKRKDWGLENRLSEATLIHYGHTEEMTRRREKVSRNYRLLQLAVEEQPGDANLLMNLGLELVRSDRRDEGLARYREAFHLLSAHPAGDVAPELREALLTQLSTHLVTSRRFVETIQILRSPLARAGDLTASMHLRLGLALMESHQMVGAAEEFRQCIAKRNRPALTPIDPNIHKAVPHHCLAQALAGLERWDAAEKSFKDALVEDSASIPLRLDFARYLHQRGQSVEALTLLHQTLSGNDDATEVWLLGGEIALSTADSLDFASDWTAEAVRNLPTNEFILRQRAQALMFRGDVVSAASEWRKLIVSGNPSDLAGFILCQLCSGALLESIPLSEERKASQEFLSHYRRLLEFSATTAIGVINERLTELSQVLPTAAERVKAALVEAAEPVAA